MLKKGINESGMLIVEATIVFPVMFLVIFIMLLAGNAYMQMCKIESSANTLALEAAAYCADPSLESVENGNIPSVRGVNVYPYRYFNPNGGDSVEGMIYSKLKKSIDEMGTGYFAGMQPKSVIITTKYNYHFIYTTFSLDLDYKIKIPIKPLGAKDYIYMNVSTRIDVPVSDSTEVIRNIDMAEDYMQQFEIDKKIDAGKEKIMSAIKKAKEWFHK